MSWRQCPRCGFNKWYDAGEGSLCVTCVERQHAQPEPAGRLVEYDFDVSPPSRSVPQRYDGGDTLNADELKAWLDMERAYGDVIDVEIRHVEGP